MKIKDVTWRRCDLHDQIARLEADVEQLAECLCRKAILIIVVSWFCGPRTRAKSSAISRNQVKSRLRNGMNILRVAREIDSGSKRK
jgi:hypothetical protein